MERISLSYKPTSINKTPHQLASEWILEIAKALNLPKGRVFGQTKTWSMNDLLYVRDNPSKYYDYCKRYNSTSKSVQNPRVEG